MRTSITTATVDGKTKLITGAEVPADVQRVKFNTLSVPGASEIKLWTPDGVKVRRISAVAPSTKAEAKRQ